MREGWREVTLGEIAARRSDFTPVIPDKLYRVVGVQRSGWGLVDREPMRGDSMKFDKLMELHVDDLVYRTITAFEAPSTVVVEAFEGAFVTPQTFPVYSLDRSQILPGFMSLLTTSPEFHEDMSSRCVGTVLRRKTLSKGSFESIPISLPPLEEQRRIVDLIAAVDDAIGTAEGEAECFRTSRLAVLTAFHAQNTQRSTPIESLCSVVIGGLWGDPPSGVGDIAVFGGSAFAGGATRVEVRHARFRSIGGSALEKRKLRDGDVILEVSGGSATQPVGRVIRVDGALPPSVPSNFMRLVRPNGNAANGYLFWRMWLRYESNETEAFQRHTTGIRNLQVPSYLASEVPILTNLNAQAEFVELAEAAEEALTCRKTTAESLKTLRSNLLTVLLSGEHEIPSSYDQLLNLDVEGVAA